MTAQRSGYRRLPALGFDLIVVASFLANPSGGAARISQTARNLLLDARVSGNIESLDQGLRRASDHMIFDLQQGDFPKASQWHEYGVGFGADLGVVDETVKGGGKV